jgi:hypothetical protein
MLWPFLLFPTEKQPNSVGASHIPQQYSASQTGLAMKPHLPDKERWGQEDQSRPEVEENLALH